MGVVPGAKWERRPVPSIRLSSRWDYVMRLKKTRGILTLLMLVLALSVSGLGDAASAGYGAVLQEGGGGEPQGSDLFDDVPVGHWADEEVGWAVSSGVMAGMADRRFDLDGVVPRWQIVTFLFRASQLVGGSVRDKELVGSGVFSDVPVGHEADREIGWAVGSGITQGVGGGRFGPDGSVTRAQIVTFLYRLTGLVDGSVAAGGLGSDSFVDVPVGHWADEEVGWAVVNGVTQGVGDGLFDLDRVVTRAQIATFLFRVVRFVEGPGGGDLGASMEVSPSMAELTALGATVQLNAEVRDQSGRPMDGEPVGWLSSDTLVATVDSQGLVTAVGKGAATITASAGAASGSAIVTVSPTFTLSGTVRDSRRNGPVLAGAVVRLENGKQESMVIGPDGRYRFPNVWGTVTVTAMATPSYVAETIKVTVSADRTIDFSLKHTGIPPYHGTVFITPNLLGPADPTSLQSVTYIGRGERVIYDRRPGAWITVNAYLFNVRYEGADLEFQVNPEFGSRGAAQTEVDTYAAALGRLPAVFLSRAQKVQINAGHKLFGGNWHDRSFLIHTDRGKEYIRDGYLEEVLIHEGAHVSLDGAHASSAGWRAAQTEDGVFISAYARDYPDREDVAESILPYFALRYRPDRLTDSDRAAVLAAIPNRLIYFDEQGFDMSPYAFGPITLP